MIYIDKLKLEHRLRPHEFFRSSSLLEDTVVGVVSVIATLQVLAMGQFTTRRMTPRSERSPSWGAVGMVPFVGGRLGLVGPNLQHPSHSFSRSPTDPLSEHCGSRSRFRLGLAQFRNAG